MQSCSKSNGLACTCLVHHSVGHVHVEQREVREVGHACGAAAKPQAAPRHTSQVKPLAGQTLHSDHGHQLLQHCRAGVFSALPLILPYLQTVHPGCCPAGCRHTACRLRSTQRWCAEMGIGGPGTCGGWGGWEMEGALMTLPCVVWQLHMCTAVHQLNQHVGGNAAHRNAQPQWPVPAWHSGLRLV